MLQTSERAELEATLPVDVAIARFRAALAARRRGDVPKIDDVPPPIEHTLVEASAQLCAISRGHLAAGRRGPAALHRIHLLLARWLGR